MKPQLDQRFSDDGAVAVPWEEVRGLLEHAELAWITTVRADGLPHVTPLVTVWHDGALHFCTGPDEQKARNVLANAHVAITTGCNSWDGGTDIVVEGHAVRVTDEPTLHELAAAWMTKWDGRWAYTVTEGGFAHDGAVDHGPVHVYAVRAAKVLAFGKGTFSQTTYLP